MVSFPYYSHIFRDSYGSGMGIVWETYQEGVPLLGVPENPTDGIWPKKAIWKRKLITSTKCQCSGFHVQFRAWRCVLFGSECCKLIMDIPSGVVDA